MHIKNLIKTTASTVALLCATAFSASAEEGSGRLGYNVTVLVGQSFSDNLAWGIGGAGGGDFSTDSGTSYVLGVSRELSRIPNLEIGLELGQTEVRYSGFNNTLTGTTLLARAQYNIAISEIVDIYGALGAGAINVKYSHQTRPNFDETVGGGLIAAGIRMQVAENIKVLTEIRHLEAFSDANVAQNFGLPPTRPAEYRNTSVNLGLQFNF